MKYVSICCAVVAVGMFGYVVNASNMTSYISSDPKVCINCHTMNTEYATWQHSSHRSQATCVDCHLPKESLIDKIFAKSRDGFIHSKAMTFRSYDHNIRISENAAERIQANCIRCHMEAVSQIIENSRLYSMDKDTMQVDRKCWDCHRTVPHGNTKGLTATPDNLGVKEALTL